MRHDASHTTEGSQAPSLTWAARLRQTGLRVTKQRLAVLNALETLPHSTADDILQSVRATLPDMTVQSIYIVLHSLVDVGLARKLDLPDSAARYETRVDDNHHHAVCVHCGRIEDVACAVGHAPCLTPSHDHGMSIQIADVVYHGVCSNCRDATAVKETTAP
ncbi:MULTISPECIES: Fur family transcriptional regulator [Citricoccus]|uniref:Fur family transcriptional regulator n=1 Tax=Citricoccus muralis TaxID=169134 RepID=A0ABY8H850_9MICC|nr:MULTISPECIES: Fur family transcriptional regulator [Citricoccus]WBL19039.1 Fur family transcriptional regulator [Citricoccus sp. NR2]WFP17333.1 Fur family transcriptional regulator [Citricoccus muralis]